RSTAEELETSKEELQSLNEELRTVNQELKIKIEEQVEATNDIQNLVNSTDIATIFLDRQSRLKRFTPRAHDLFHVIPTDVGRPLSDINSSLLDVNLTASIDRVLDRLERFERELQAKDGRWYLLRIVPYRTADDHIEGVVLTFVDITERKRVEDFLRASETRLREAQGGLEQQVADRTQDLTTAVGQLDTEVRDRRLAEGRVRGLLGRLITVQEDERRRIARDLHDHLGQQIAALRLRLESLRHLEQRGAPVTGELSQIDALIDRLDRDLDFFTWELRPPTLDDLGIVVALGNFVREWSRNFRIPARFHSHDLDDGRLRPEIETTLYRISQEALNNIYKHAHATQVGVLLERREHEVVLIVEDNGRGFDRATTRAGDRAVGLTGMSERALLVGGTLDIETAPGEGTSVFVKVPAVFVGSA
ncbi:MAG TPA: PAS domain-containing protein, partial [Vicinamibacterales bacterium]|nr:PAS domain-containing protein [Vicinamibacterales bacterium]